MQLYHFSSFLEIITGVYISMCMDDVLKGIWSPKYYTDLKSALKEYYLQNHDDFIDRIVKTNEQKADSIKKYMKNRALFFISTCMILLLLSGFENTYSGNDSLFHMSLFFAGSWTIVLLMFNKYLFSNKQYTAVAIIILIVLTSISYILNKVYLQWNISNNIVIISVLTILIIPILWQAFICWMFSSAYKGYIRNKLAEGKKNYEQAEKGLAEHNPKIIPSRYKTLYMDSSIQSDNAEKAKTSCLDQYLEIMEQEIAEASNPKSVFKIFTSWVWFHLFSSFNNLAIILHLKRSETISQQES